MDAPAARPDSARERRSGVPTQERRDESESSWGNSLVPENFWSGTYNKVTLPALLSVPAQEWDPVQVREREREQEQEGSLVVYSVLAY